MAPGEDRWRQAALGVVEPAGFDLEELSVVNAGRRRIVRVVVDSDDGLGLDRAADLSRALSDAFDEMDLASGGDLPPYTLEVTSPGIGRPLTEPRHFRRARGRLVSLTDTDGRAREVRVLGVTDTGVDVLTGAAGTVADHVPFATIARAKVEVEFSAPSAAVAALLAADPRTAEVAARTAADHADTGNAEIEDAEVGDTEIGDTEDTEIEDTVDGDEEDDR